jgi:TRAP-type C4-dicarboxylate transport system permease small subunit
MDIGNVIRKAIALEEFITQVMMGFIVVLVFIAALTRYLGYPINWSVDIAQAVFVWVIYVGANQAWRNSRHIGIDLLFKQFSPKIQFYLQLFLYVVIAVFLVSLIIYGIQITIVNAGRILGDIPISYSFVTIAVPVGSFLMLLTTVEKSYTLFRMKAEAETKQ